MYHRHFGLDRSPFSSEPEPGFLWLGPTHREALTALSRGIRENQGLLLLTGDAGTGKTALARGLLAELSEEVIAAVIPDPSLSLSDFLTLLADGFGMASPIEGKHDFLTRFKKTVRSACDARKSLLIIVDEAQRLTGELLDEIRMLADIDCEGRASVNVLFAAQEDFNRTLQDPRNRALKQRIVLSRRLVALNREETGAYIRHRLRVAGSEQALFTPEALEAVFTLSEGIPRRINVICDGALTSAYMRGIRSVDGGVIRESAREFDTGLPPAVATPDRTAASPAEEEPESEEALSKPAGPARKPLVALAVAAIALLAAVLLVRSPEKKGVTPPAAEKSPAPAPAEAPRQEVATVETTPAEEPSSPPATGSPKDDEPSPSGGKAASTLFFLFFKPGSTELEASSYDTLRLVSDYLSAHPSSEVVLSTHAAGDARIGSILRLQELRAAGIRSVLAAQPRFKGGITLVDAYDGPEEDGWELPTGAVSKPRAEIRIRHHPQNRR